MRHLLCLVLIGCGSTPAPTDAGREEIDGGRDAGKRQDAGSDAGHDAGRDAGGCPAPCNDGNPCTDDVCDGDACAFTNNSSECDFDGDPCTRDVCASGACTAGGPRCSDPQMCDETGTCVCPFADLRPCGALCISTPTCCDDSDCTDPFTCPGPGSFCNCPSGTRPCDGECISAATGCCADTDCGTLYVCRDHACVAP